MKKLEKPNMEIVRFDTDDVVVAKRQLFWSLLGGMRRRLRKNLRAAVHAELQSIRTVMLRGEDK